MASGSYGSSLGSATADAIVARATQVGELAETMFTAAQNALDGFSGASVSPVNVSGSAVANSPDLGTATLAQRPSAYVSVSEDVSLTDLQSLRDSLSLSEVTLKVLDMPVFSKPAPELTEYADPEEIPVTVPDSPELGVIDKPNKPALNLPDTSVLQGLQEALDSIVIPSAPETQRVEMENILGPWDATAPDLMFVYSEGTYQSDLQDAVRLALLSYAKDGGTGLTAEVEEAIWGRALSRFEDERTKARDEAMSFWESRGHDLPPGAMTSALREIESDHLKRLTDLNRDLLVQSSDLAQKNTQFFLNAGLQYEKQLMDYTNQIALRSFEAAKETVKAVSDQARLVLEYRQARREDRRLDAEIFREKVQAELTELQKVKLELEAGNLAADIQQKKANLFLTRYEEAKILIALFSEEMKGAELEASLERLKFEGFDSLLKTVQSKIALNTARYNYQQAKWANNETKARAYSAEVEAYSKQVDAKKVEADIDIAQGDAVLKRNQQGIEILKAALEKLDIESKHQASLEDSAVKAHAAQTDLYRADIQALSEHYRNLVERFRVQVTADAAQGDIAVRQAEANSRLAAAVAEIEAKAAEAKANIAAQLAASAMSAVSTSMNIGYSESVSESYGSTVSDSTSLSNIHTWPHST